MNFGLGQCIKQDLQGYFCVLETFTMRKTQIEWKKTTIFNFTTPATVVTIITPDPYNRKKQSVELQGNCSL